jgi:murein L,D-transpeptidase YafK
MGSFGPAAPFRCKTSAFRGAFFATALAVLPSTAFALTIELKDVAPDRVERQRAAAKGAIPLPNTPEVGRTAARLAEKGLAVGNPLMIRVFKQVSELEIWMEKEGVYVHFATYPICHWSGTLGPKQREGDKQTPEGFYTVTSRQLHRAGRWTRALNLGFPNVYDEAQARSGSYILVHGGCSSVGCFAMTDPVMAEVYQLTSAALQKGQAHIPVHVFPFRMTDENLSKHRTSEWHQFWMNLKEGYDTFERTHRPPRISVCDNRYVVQEAGPEEVAAPGPLEPCAATAARIAELVASNGFAPPIRLPRQAGARPVNPKALALAATAHRGGAPARKEFGRRASAHMCNMARASCRKYTYLRNKVAERGNRNGIRSAKNGR